MDGGSAREMRFDKLRAGGVPRGEVCRQVCRDAAECAVAPGGHIAGSLARLRHARSPSTSRRAGSTGPVAQQQNLTLNDARGSR